MQVTHGGNNVVHSSQYQNVSTMDIQISDLKYFLPTKHMSRGRIQSSFWLIVIIMLLTATRGSSGQECSTEDISQCVTALFNLSHPIISLPLDNTTALHQLCSVEFPAFKDCFAQLVDNCSSVELLSLSGLNSTADLICEPATATVLDQDWRNATNGVCLRGVLESEMMQACGLEHYEHVVSDYSSLPSTFCSDVVTFLTCVRWTTWAFCGEDVAELLHDVNKLALDGAITSARCTLIGDENPAGLAMSYIVSGFGFFSPPSPILMRIYRNPIEWLPNYFSNGSDSLSRGVIQSTGFAVVFAHIAVDYWNSRLLWVDKYGKSVNELPLYFTGTVTSQVVYGALSGDVRAIAVDWTSQYLYVADANYTQITQISYKTGNIGHFKTIVKDPNLTPSGIVTHPRIGRLYWSDSKRHVIEYSRLNGDNRTLFTSTIAIQSPGALAIDYDENRLYWINNGGNGISSCLVNGEDCRDDVTKDDGISKFVDIEVYQDYIFVTPEKDELQVYDKYNTSILLGEVEYARTNGDASSISKAYSVAVSAPDKQYPYNSPCSFQNGGCDQLCSEEPGHEAGRTCTCSLGYQLGEDGQTCVTDPFTDELLLVADSEAHKIYMIHVDTEEVQSVPIPVDAIPRSLAFDHETATVLWVNSNSVYRLMRTTVDGSSTQTVMNFGSGSANFVAEIVYDMHSKHLYYTMHNTGSINKLNLAVDSAAPSVVVRSWAPYDLALDVGTKTLFWTDPILRVVYRASMEDGSGKRAIASENMLQPTGLALDTKERMVFWCDTIMHTVEVVGMDGRNRRRIIGRIDDSNPIAIAVDAGSLFIAGSNSRHLKRFNRTTSEIDTFGPAEFQRAISIRVYRADTEEYIHQTTTTTTSTTTTLPPTTTTTLPPPTTTTTTLPPPPTTTTTPSTTTTTTLPPTTTTTTVPPTTITTTTLPPTSTNVTTPQAPPPITSPTTENIQGTSPLVAQPTLVTPPSGQPTRAHTSATPPPVRQPTPVTPPPGQPTPAPTSATPPPVRQPTPVTPPPGQPTPAPTPATPPPVRQPTPVTPPPGQPTPATPTPSQPTPATTPPGQPTPATPPPSQPTPATQPPGQPTPATPPPSQPSPATPPPSQPTPATPPPSQPTPATPPPGQPTPATPPPSQPTPATSTPGQPTPATPPPGQPTPATPPSSQATPATVSTPPSSPTPALPTPATPPSQPPGTTTDKSASKSVLNVTIASVKQEKVDDGLHPGVVAAIVIVSILVLLAILGGLYFYRFRNNTLLTYGRQSSGEDWDDRTILEDAPSPTSDTSDV